MTRISPSKSHFFLLIYFAFVFLLLEASSRLFWRTQGISFVHAHQNIYHYFYPEMQDVEHAPVTRSDPVFDILLLGNSVLNPQWGSIEQQLIETLTYRLKRKVRTYNLSMPGHTVLDSYYKYKRLYSKYFDLVIVYHGINEARANNVPPHLFRDDFSHYSWYRRLKIYESEPKSEWVVFPYTARFSWIRLSEEM